MQSRHALALAAAAAVALVSPLAAHAQQRVLGTDISYWNCGTSATGISQTNWNTAFNTPNANGYTRQFVFIRATRGGTTGLSQTSGTPSGPSNTGQETLSRRYDDPRFLQNITRATTAGMLAGPYHYGRPDVAGNTGTDEANHFIQMAGLFMRPGYLMPVFDLEAGTSANALAQFSLDFSNRIYTVMGIRPAMYINGNHTNHLVGSATAAQLDLIAEPQPNTPSVVGPAYPMLWNARYHDQDEPGFNPETIPVQTGSPKTSPTVNNSYYGPWDDYGDTDPWSVWQYASVVSIPGFNNVDSTLDGNVSHGDIEYMRNSLVPAVWWNNSSGDWGTQTNWNSGQPVTVPTPGAGQTTPYAYDSAALPTPRLPGAAGTGPTSGQFDTVILERTGANITVTHSTGTTNIRKLFMRETLNITGGSLTINYNPTYRPDTSALVRHAGPISAQFSGPVTLGGTGALSVHTLQVDATRTFALNAGTLTLNTINLMPGATPAKINVGGNVTFNALSGAAAVIKNGAGLGTSGNVDLTGGARNLTVNNGASAIDLLISAPVTNGSITKLGTGTLALSNATLTAATVSAGTLEVPAGGTVNVANALHADGTGIASIKGTANVKKLTGTSTISINGGRVNVTPDGTAAGTSRVSNLQLTGGGELNLNDNDIVFDYAAGASPETQVRNWVRDGRIAGSTSGIFSTPGSPDDDKVLAVADNAAWGKSTFNGMSIGPNTVVGKYTYFGDANLDGKVTGDDYLNVDANLGTGDSWLEGDFNMSGVTTGDDYLAIDANLGKGTATPLAFAELKEEMVALHAAMFGEEYLVKLAQAEAEGFGASVVPEPASLSLIGVAAVSLLRRRRR